MAAVCEASKMNLATLQRVDPSISSIVDNASQVALYKYISETQEWEKTEIEGTLFVYMRSQKPQHGFIVMNRLSKTNLVEPITEDLDFQPQSPFLLYRNGKGHIYGIWFYEKKNCTKIGKLLTSLSQLTASKQDNNNSRMRSYSESNKKHQKQENTQSDIMSLLSRAQDEYDKKTFALDHTPKNFKKQNTHVSGTDIVKPTPVRINGVVLDSNSTPLSIGMLFAQAGDATNSAMSNDLNTRIKSITSSIKHGHSNFSPGNAETILQSFLSNPTHTLEHIEKKQKDSSRSKNKGSSGATKGHQSPEKRALSANERLISVQTLEKDLREKLNLLPKTSCDEMNKSDAFGLKSDELFGEIAKSEPIDIPILTPAMLESSSFSSPPDKCGEGYLLDMNNSSSSKFKTHTNVVNHTRSFSPTQLLSPMDFAIPSGKQKIISSGLPSSCSPDLINFMNEPFNDNEKDILTPQKTLNGYGNVQSSKSNVTPLNKNQLREALIYMLQNDDGFVTEIHECYLKHLKGQLPYMNTS